MQNLIVQEVTTTQARDMLLKGLGHNELSVAKVMMTPELAAEFLERNPGNRPIRMSKVNETVEAIRRGEWLLTHQGAAVCSNGTLRDGQHRVMAIRLAEKAVPIHVWWNLPPDTMNVIDTGLRRNIADVFHLEGIGEAQIISSAARMLYRYRNDAWGAKSAGTNTQIIACYNREPDISNHISQGRQLKGAGFSPAMGVLLVHLTEHAEVPPGVDRTLWYNQVGMGENIQRGMPAFQLRQAIRSWEERNIRVSQRLLVGAYAKAWTHYVKGENISTLRFQERDVMPDIEHPLRPRKNRT